MTPSRIITGLRLFQWTWCPAFMLWDLWWAAVRVTEARWGGALYFFTCAAAMATVLCWQETWYRRTFRDGQP